MTILTIKVPDGKTPDVSKYVKNIGGEVISNKKQIKAKAAETDDQEDEVTHEAYFGENIKRAIKAFSK
jgi:hypothetical protein